MEDKERVFINRLKTIRSFARLVGFIVFFPLYIPPMLFFFARNKVDILMDIEANYTGKLSLLNYNFLIFLCTIVFSEFCYHRLSLGLSQIHRYSTLEIEPFLLPTKLN